MTDRTDLFTRRSFHKRIGLAAAGPLITVRSALAQPKPISLFDGRTLQGWTQIENNATSLSTAGITDPAAFAARILRGSDPLSASLRARLPESVNRDPAAYIQPSPEAKAALAALLKELNQILWGPSIYEEARFRSAALRPETRELLHRNPQGQDLARLNKLLLEDAWPDQLARSAATGWIVKDGAMASTGAGRGVIYTAKDYDRFRLKFTMRHVSGNPDHQACVLIFCARPQSAKKPLDALGGIQFQVPNGGHWDYRPGMTNNGGPEFTLIQKPQFHVHDWSSVEILADAGKGTARMAVAQPPGSKAIEVLNFQDPAAGKAGPIAWQMHNAGLFDEYKDVSVELNPSDKLITVG